MYELGRYLQLAHIGRHELCYRLLKPLIETDAISAPWALIRVPADRKYGEVLRVVEALRASGISTIRFEAAEAR